MITYKSIVALFVLIVVGTVMLCSQTVMRDVVYLKNGSIVKGTIIEMVPNQSIKIQTGDGSVFVYTMAEVDRITKEEVSKASTQTSPLFSSDGQEAPSMFSIFGGVSIPLGDFEKEDNIHAGAAKTGFTLGAQYVSGGGIVGYFIQASYTQNTMKDFFAPFDVYNGTLDLTTTSSDFGSWKQIMVLGGPKIGTAQKNGPNFFFAPLIGLDLCMSPPITGEAIGDYRVSFSSYPYYTYVPVKGSGEIPSKMELVIAYGAAAEFIFDNFTMAIKYLAAQPKFEIDGSVKYSGSNTYASVNGEYKAKLKYEPNISVLLITMGVVL